MACPAPFHLTSSGDTKRRPSRSFLRSWVVLGLAAVVAGGCKGLSAPNDGTIEFVVSTKYDGREPLGSEVRYTAYVQDTDGSNHRAEQLVAPQGKVKFTNLGVGFELQIGLTDLPEGCRASPNDYPIELTHGERNRTMAFTVTCSAVPGPTGSLSVQVTGPTGGAADITVTGSGYSKALTGSATLADLAPGDYHVAALPVAVGAVTWEPTPTDQDVTVQEGATATASVAYAPVPGSLTVDVTGLSGVNADVTVTGPGGFSQALTATTVLDNLPPGTYTVAANSVTDGPTTWVPTPTSQDVDVASASAATATVTYEAVQGVGSLDVTITGLPAPLQGDVTVTGPAGFTQALTGSATLTDLEPGTYTVSAASFTADYRMEPDVAVQEAVVKVDETAQVEVLYYTVSDNLLVDPSWEIGLVTVATPVIPDHTGEWHGDKVATKGQENGITPYDGLAMLQFIATGPFGPGAGSKGSELFQLLDVTSLASVIAGGTVQVQARAVVDRIAGDAETDTQFIVDVYALDGAPADARDKLGSQTWLARNFTDLRSDADPATWEPVVSEVDIPAGTTVVLLRVLAGEDVKDDATDPEFDGHYMDDASLVIRWIR